MPRHLALLAILALSCTAAADDCGTFDDCGSCTDSDSADCGWCSDGGRVACELGSESGPEVGSCANWAWVDSECGATGCDFSDCSSCTSAASCGWCSSSSTCEVGTASGPDSGSCSSWDYDACATPTCGSLTACDTCTEAPGGLCGWCASSSKCSLGTSSGPASGSCSAWEWTDTQCTGDAVYEEDFVDLSSSS